MHELQIRPYCPADEQAVIALWQQCGMLVTWDDPRQDIRRKLALQPELFLVGTLDAQIVATVMAGYDGHRGWLNYVAIAPEYRRHGFGRQIVMAAEQRLRALGCPKINLQVRASNAAVVAFYRRLGFSVDEAISMGKRLIES